MLTQFPRFHMALWAAIAVSWVILGANSGNVPWGSDTFWLVSCGLTAGAALGVASRGTRNSMCVYLVAATTIATIRASAYLSNDAGSPAWVYPELMRRSHA